jgi:hypothetical protein
MTGYQVGQILYILPSTKTAVVPVQVVEEITKKTLRGREVSYMVRFGKDADKILDINDIQGEIYDSSDQVKRVLVERSTSALNRLVNNAVEKAKSWYSGAFEGGVSGPMGDTDLEEALLGSGKPRDPRGRFVPSEAPPPEPEETPGTGTTVQLPDGTVANVKMPDVLTG